MKNNFFNSLSERYEIVATLGTGSFGTVYLARHHILECFRAIKVIPSNHDAANTIISEAKLLKSLHHPGIPTIYEIEEDTDYYYLIEEYLEGETLEEFLLSQKHISHHTFYNFCSQLCEIFCYLHNFHPNPIIYMDLKPEHIIVCEMQLKLIDFNACVNLSNSGNLCNLYGNRIYSAPEIKSGALPNPQWDIYSIGMIFMLMKKYLDTPLSQKTQKIIKKAITTDPACRYETVDRLSLDIAGQQKQPQEHSCKTIAVFGSHSGCGTTHIAISLVSVLNYMGYSTCYYERNDSNCLLSITKHLFHAKEEQGCIRYRYFRGFPNYGPGIFLPSDTSDIMVYDYGSHYTSNNDSIFEADMILYICSNGVWTWQDAIEKSEAFSHFHENRHIICNMGTKQSLSAYAKEFHKVISSYPYDPNPFLVNSAKCNFVSYILQTTYKRRGTLFSHLKRLFFPKK